jgi:hypothetical protein
MLPTTKYGLTGLTVGVILGAVGAYLIPSSDKGSAQVAPSTSYGGAKTKHNRKHNNKSRKHH